MDQDEPDDAASLRTKTTVCINSPRDLFGARQIVSERLKRVIDFRIDEQVPLERLEGYCDKVDRLAEEHGEHGVSVSELRRRVDDLTRRFEEVDRLQRWTANELERIVPQVSAQESQLESLREKIAAVPAADGPQIDEARTLIEEIRREHMQVRVRLTAVARYEDRLRKLEDRSE